jgi:hypothetical protein
MQTTKISVFVCALAFSAAVTIRAVDTPAQASARAAVAAKLFELDAETPPATNTAAKPAVVAPAEKTAVMTPVNGEAKAQKEAAKKAAVKAALAASAAPEMKPIVAPASPISASKEQRLQELLAKYKADQVSPNEYQIQRAAILAEP